MNNPDKNDIGKGTTVFIGGVFAAVVGLVQVTNVGSAAWGWLMLLAGAGLMIWGAWKIGTGWKQCRRRAF